MKASFDISSFGITKLHHIICKWDFSDYQCYFNDLRYLNEQRINFKKVNLLVSTIPRISNSNLQWDGFNFEILIYNFLNFLNF